MFPYSPQQPLVVATANFQILVNVTKRYASGLQQLAELNLQTVKTVFAENTSVLKAGSSAKPGEFLRSQSALFPAIPEKAAAYTRHFLKIVRAMEVDILNEARGLYERYGFGMKGVFESATRPAQPERQGPIALLSNFPATSTGAANETGWVLDASAAVAQTSKDTSGETAEADSSH